MPLSSDHDPAAAEQACSAACSVTLSIARSDVAVAGNVTAVAKFGGDDLHLDRPRPQINVQTFKLVFVRTFCNR